MDETLRCAACGEENPHDARFCIECGGPLAPAATTPTGQVAIGVTVKLDGPACSWCGAANPEGASFCVFCGRALVPQPPPRPTPRPSHSRPRVSAPPRPRQAWQPPRPPAPVRRPPARPSSQQDWPGLVIGLLFVGGLLLVLSGILSANALMLACLVAIGLMLVSGRVDRRLKPLLLIAALVMLVANGWFWPGMFIFFFLGYLGRR
jgi:hypothetical protein